LQRPLLLLLALLLAACPRGTGTPGARTKPKLVVLIVIDQWPSWVFEKQQKLFTGGLRRLLREGAVVMNAEIPYANTYTAAGHSALGTGAAPNVHGIIGNSWWRRDEERERDAEFDPSTPTLRVGPAIGNENEDEGASARMLKAEGIADVLRRATSGTGKSVSVALKARSACLMAGKKPDLAIWYAAEAGGMTTSKAYADEPPPWLVALASTYPASRYFDATWDPRDPTLLARETGIPDDAPGEKSDHGLGPAFPHSLAAAKNPAHALIATPFADELVSQAVSVAMSEMKLGKDPVPDFLAISFGAHDYAGHDWGPDSWEVLDLTLRLDSALGELFELLDARVGVDQWAVIVTSDHGATPVIERGRFRSARRITPSDIERPVETAVTYAVGVAGTSWMAKVTSSNVYMSAKFRELSPQLREAGLDAAAKAIRGVPGIAFAGRTDKFSPDCKAEKDTERAICLSVVPGESGELYAYPTAGSGITSYPGGTTHDAPFDDNRRVPILIKAPGVPHQVGDGTLLQVAPTIAALLGIPPPEAAKESPLFEIERR
jgi:predicted AlkP superfamily pyrophosphatase or phosphodiesterase